MVRIVFAVIVLSVTVGMFSGCSSIRSDNEYWSFEDCETNPSDDLIHPALVKELKRGSSAMTAESVANLKKASALEPDLSGLLRMRRHLNASTLPPNVNNVAITNASVPGEPEIPLRVYSPKTVDPKMVLPVVIYLHGGGWCVGSAANTDIISAGLCRYIPALVVSVDYRLAPENRYPAALDDVVAAILWVKKNAAKFHADPDRIYLAGDSAGGNLAAAAALRNNVGGGPGISGMILFYPALNLYNSKTFSRERFGNGYGFDNVLFDAFVSCYVPDPRDRNRHFISPLFADMRYMPSALVVTAQFDPLRDDGLKFAERMKNQAKRVRYLCLRGMTHAYLETLALRSDFALTMNEAAEFVRRTSSDSGANQ